MRHHRPTGSVPEAGQHDTRLQARPTARRSFRTTEHGLSITVHTRAFLSQRRAAARSPPFLYHRAAVW
jgi:hypothetical protein